MSAGTGPRLVSCSGGPRLLPKCCYAAPPALHALADTSQAWNMCSMTSQGSARPLERPLVGVVLPVGVVFPVEVVLSVEAVLRLEVVLVAPAGDLLADVCAVLVGDPEVDP